MKTLAVITDPQFEKPAARTVLNNFFVSLLRDERDLPFIYLILKLTFTLLPLGILLFLPLSSGWLWWPMAAGYLYFNNITKSSFGLMSHCSCHRKLFKDKFGLLNNYIPWVLAPFYGQSPGTYFSHHVLMHHPENNLPDDKSCTMFYKRDSLSHFIRYWANFFFLGLYQLSSYFLKKKKPEVFLRVLAGELLFYGFCIAMCFVNLPAAIVVFIVPFLISRVVMMVGNWVQHAFVSAEEPGNEYKNSITCINTRFNHRCWNDGYHASHHVRPAMHWTEHPKNFLNNLDKYFKNDAIVFDGIDYGNVFKWLMLKRYDLLAKNFVNVGGRFASDEEVIRLLKARTLPVAIVRP